MKDDEEGHAVGTVAQMKPRDGKREMFARTAADRHFVESGAFAAAGPAARAVWHVLMYHADEDGLAWPGDETLMRETGLSRATVRRGVGDLVSLGYLLIDGRVGTGTRRYRMCVPAAHQRLTGETVNVSRVDTQCLTPETDNVSVVDQRLTGETVNVSRVDTQCLILEGPMSHSCAAPPYMNSREQSHRTVGVVRRDGLTAEEEPEGLADDGCPATVAAAVAAWNAFALPLGLRQADAQRPPAKLACRLRDPAFRAAWPVLLSTVRDNRFLREEFSGGCGVDLAWLVGNGYWKIAGGEIGPDPARGGGNGARRAAETEPRWRSGAAGTVEI